MQTATGITNGMLQSGKGLKMLLVGMAKQFFLFVHANLLPRLSRL